MDPVRRPRRVIGPQILDGTCGLALSGCSAAVIVESISGGAVSGALAERRRQRLIEQLRDHVIICGYELSKLEDVLGVDR